MEIKPSMKPRIIHSAYDREEKKYALVNAISNLCSRAITEHLKEKPKKFPSPLLCLVFHCGGTVCWKSLCCDQFTIMRGKIQVNSADLQRDFSVSAQVNRLLRELRAELHLL